MGRVVFRGSIALLLCVLHFGTPTLVQAENQSSSLTKTQKYLNQSLDTSLAAGNEDSESELTASIDTESSGTTMTWFFIKVVIGLGTILGGIWLISKFIEQSGMAGSGNELMGVRSTLALGQNQYLQIVQVGSQYFMLGVTESSVTKLGEITETDTIEGLRREEDQASNGEGPRGFSEIISNFLGTNNHDFKGKNTSEFLDDLTERVSQLNDEATTNQ